MTVRPLTSFGGLADAYLLRLGVRETSIQARLRAETQQLPERQMQIGPDQGAFMAMLARLIGARTMIEIGTFTGYSALWLAGALPPDGQLICCDISETWTQIGRRYWAEAEIEDRIDLRLGPAVETLRSLEQRFGRHWVDLIFIDADKANYDLYYETALRLTRPGGLILLDNTLWSGRVADPAARDPDTRALQALNAKLHTDPRIDLVLLPIGDGLTLARPR